MRHDGASNAQKRIEIDRQIFNDEVKLHANYLVDVSQKALMKLQKKFIVYVKSKYFCIY